MKNLAKLVGIIAFVAIIGFAMAACDNGDSGGGGGGNTIYGTWICTTGTFQPFTLTISAGTIRWEDIDGDYVQYADVQWGELTANTNDTHKTNYPEGFTFTGTRTSKQYENITFGFIALAADGQSVYVGEDASTTTFLEVDTIPIFTKQ